MTLESYDELIQQYLCAELNPEQRADLRTRLLEIARSEPACRVLLMRLYDQFVESGMWKAPPLDPDTNERLAKIEREVIFGRHGESQPRVASTSAPEATVAAERPVLRYRRGPATTRIGVWAERSVAACLLLSSLYLWNSERRMRNAWQDEYRELAGAVDQFAADSEDEWQLANPRRPAGGLTDGPADPTEITALIEERDAGVDALVRIRDAVTRLCRVRTENTLRLGRGRETTVATPVKKSERP